jgi:hypothetical protein
VFALQGVIRTRDKEILQGVGIICCIGGVNHGDGWDIKSLRRCVNFEARLRGDREGKGLSHGGVWGEGYMWCERSMGYKRH